MAVLSKETVPQFKCAGLRGHIKPHHLLVFDNAGRNVIPDTLKLVAGRVGQEYNIRKNRKGAFWQYHYHATYRYVSSAI